MKMGRKLIFRMKRKENIIMDFSEEAQLHMYELKEEKKSLELEISEEQYANSCLHQKRSMLSVSIIKNIIVFLYFLLLYGGIRFLEHINTMWDGVKDNPVILKLLEMIEHTSLMIQIILLLVMAVTIGFFVRKLYLIWLNSEHPAAMQLAEKQQRLTYSRQIADSNQKLAGYYFHLQEIEDELEQCTKV